MDWLAMIPWMWIVWREEKENPKERASSRKAKTKAKASRRANRPMTKADQEKGMAINKRNSRINNHGTQSRILGSRMPTKVIAVAKVASLAKALEKGKMLEKAKVSFAIDVVAMVILLETAESG